MLLAMTFRVNFSWKTGQIIVKLQYGAVAELADAMDLKSIEGKTSCGFDSHPRHWIGMVIKHRAGSSPAPGIIIL